MLACFHQLSEPYDRAFAFSSLFISLAAWYCPVPWLASLMYMNAAVSFLHWARWHKGLCWMADIGLSTSNLVCHLYIATVSKSLNLTRSLCWCTASLCIFMAKSWLKPRQQAMKQYHVLQLIPHGAFRFCGFWSVMAADGHAFNLRLSLVYWSVMVLFGMPLPSEELRNCKGGLRQYVFGQRC